MDNERVERIRVRAHAIWEEEGRPEGREVEHWQRAVSEIEAEDAVSSEATGTSDRKRRRAAGSASEQGDPGKTTKAPSTDALSTEVTSAGSGRRSAGKATPASRNAPASAREGGVEPVPRRERKASSGSAGSAAASAGRTVPIATREGGVDPVPRGDGGAIKAAAGASGAGVSPEGKKGTRAAGRARRTLESLKPATTRSRSRKPS